jgi:hypothetical protein
VDNRAVRRVVGIAGVVLVAAASVTLIITALNLGNGPAYCASGPTAFRIRHHCSESDVINAGVFGAAIMVMVAGSFAVAFTFGSWAMIVVMGAGFLAAGTALLIQGSSSGIEIMAGTWALMGLGFCIGGGIALARQIREHREHRERPRFLGTG